jgi:hypothetical protein
VKLPALERARRSALEVAHSLRVAAANIGDGPLANAMRVAAVEADDLARRVTRFCEHARVLRPSGDLKGGGDDGSGSGEREQARPGAA